MLIFYVLLTLGFGLGLVLVLIIFSLLNLAQKGDAYLERLESLIYLTSSPAPLRPDEIEKIFQEADSPPEVSIAAEPKVYHRL
jgi:hypothetical protein